MFVNVKVEGEGYLQLARLYDTGSQVCFVNDSLMKQHAAELLSQTRPCPFHVHGAGGDTITVQDIISLECNIGRRTLMQDFVIVPVCEPILLGLDFTVYQKAGWDWITHVCY